MAERKWGLFRGKSENDFVSDNEVKRKLAMEGQLEPVIEGGRKPKSLKDYINLAKNRSKEAKDFSPQAQGEVRITSKHGIIVNFMADLHSGHPETHHERIQQEVEVVKNTPDSYFLLGGDLVEGVHWGGAGGSEQIMSLDEQRGFLRSFFKEVKGRVIGAVSGEHDSKWAAKTGADPYEMFTDETGAPYKRGLMELKVKAGDQEYSGLVAHKLRGNSIYNNLHPPMRASKEIQGHDFYVAGHTHRKAIGQQPIRNEKGAKTVTFGISGPYKETDDYTQRSGWISQKTKQLFGFAMRFHADEHKIDIEEDIVKANKKWGNEK